MANKVFETLLKEKVDIFVQSFIHTSKSIFVTEEGGRLIHPAEYGFYRENICKEFIKYFIPARIQIGQGFVINTNDEISTQCDLVLYDKYSTPLLENEEKQRFYPIETVCAIGEVKSVLNKNGLKESINKLAYNKKIREFVKGPSFIRRESRLRDTPYNPYNIPYDNIFTFIICEKFSFNFVNIAAEINELYEDGINQCQKHNLILSIEDGILLYYDKNNKAMMYPQINKDNLKNRFVSKSANPYCHFKLFASYLFLGTESCSIIYPEITNYIGSLKGGYNYDEK